MNFLNLRPGTSVEGDTIEAFRTEGKAGSYLYLIAGVHGDEVEGVYVLQQLYDWLQKTEEIDLPIIVLPIQNIDGYRVGTRTNSHGVDLNRNLPASNWDENYSEEKYNPGSEILSEPENQYLDKLFQKYKPGFIISFHSWKALINYNGDSLDVAEYLGKYNEYPIADDVGYPTPGSLGTYAPEKFGAGVITFECPVISDEHTLKSIWDKNEEGLKELLQSDLLKTKLS